MKLNLLHILVILFLGLQVHGQGQISENIRFGFKLAPHISWMGTDTKLISSESLRTGMGVGTIVEWYLNENYVLSSGIGITFGQWMGLRRS